jgi:SAM-dependent methyltransferase
MSVSKRSHQLTGRLLDVGCGTKPYISLFHTVHAYIGMDYDSPAHRSYTKADIFYNGGQFPFEQNSFDSILSTEVLEHVFNREEHLKECFRVLKPGGLMLLTTPFVWDEHSQPYDFGRYSSFGLTHVMNEAGFEVIELHKTCPNLSMLFQLANCYICKKLPMKRQWIRLLFYCLLTMPVTVLGSLAGAIFPCNQDLYLSNVILVRRPLHT